MTNLIIDYQTIANNIMPNPNFEIKDFQYYTWRITAWSGLEKRITSREFVAGSWKWRILLYPTGSNNPDYISIYLDFADPKGAPAGWNSNVQFAFLLWNPENPISSFSDYKHHYFTAENSSSGIRWFYDLHKLFVPLENLTHSIIENDTCNITVFVRILEDPTSVPYLFTKIVTPDNFARHQGFDLANFDDQSVISQFKVLRSETYRTFKAMVALKFGYSAERIRFWVFWNRENKTFRPGDLITDNYLDMTMGEIYIKMVGRQNELKFFLEVADKPIDDKTWFPHTEGNSCHIMILIKYFNYDTQSLEGLGHLYVKELDKICDIIPILCEKKEFPPHTPLRIYEEVTPSTIERMNPKWTFQQSEIQNGDIICFQKDLTEEKQEFTAAAFYESLSMRIVVLFKQRYKDQEQKPEFKLVLNKKYTYDDVAKRVAAHLSTDPLKLRFTTEHPIFDTHKIVIERATSQTLSEMLQATHIPNLVNILYYEILSDA
ncbi:ICP0-binding domain of ubiquitin-specific protease 7-domain-containing protein [Gigaspora rosea]|uniref:ICP0-binding domain of ubiquitin-specific protease 7-domain-containing protein n=1 Tax=Gigaspora rosea TaxID=44941 RepID=A0A397UT85_9GLOM|nr:ICP0-binding domain of ubiquitin-specific protease 7-domain-containing protein [Gigaspora rosea]